MPKLTDTQLIVLSAAAQREDGAALVPDRLNKSAASKVAVSLISRKLMRETCSKPGMPVWRTDESDRQMSILITRAGRDAIAAEEPVEPAAPVQMSIVDPKPRAENERAKAGLPRSGSKQALVVAMLEAESGATIDALIASTGWLPHTTRAALTGLRKRGYAIERFGEKGRQSVYRIVSAYEAPSNSGGTIAA